MTAVVPRRTPTRDPVVEERARPPRDVSEPAAAGNVEPAVTKVRAEARNAARDLHDAVIWSDRSVYRGSQWRRIRAPVEPGDDGDATEPATESIGKAAGRGLRWSLIGAFVGRFGGLALGMVLARLLSPADFGLYAIALGAMYFVMHINDVGLIAATVQWRGRIEEMAPTATTLAVTFSVAIYALFFAFAPAFAGLAGNPEAAPIVRVLTTVILIDGVTAVRAGYLVRTFQQQRITTANLMGLVVQATVAITLAVHGVGAMSFAAGQVSGALVIGVFVLWSAHMPWRFGFDRAVARRLMHFGVPLALALGLEAILMNADYVIVGRTLGAVALGFYLLAFNISGWAPGVIGTAIRWVSIPSFSRLSEQEGALAPAVHRSITVLVTAVLPIGFLTAVLALPLIEVLYGTEWLPSAPVLRFLIILGLARMLTQLALDILTGAGATRATLWFNLGWAVALVPALIIGTRADGTRGAAIAHAVVVLLVALPLAFAALRRIGVPLLPIARGVVRPLLAAAAATAITTIVRELIPGAAFVQLAATGAVGLATYALLVVPAEQLRKLIAQGRERLGAPRARRAASPAIAGAPAVEGEYRPAHLRRNGGGQA
ncbi:MAG TPA: oligosaccharide flippase family protein [Acidimicrobiales bacterium]|nr:oligosaccharide flippase family protein [Acidimicrobiales bacterium]